MPQALRWTLIDEWLQEEAKRQDAQENSRKAITMYKNNNISEVYLLYKGLQLSQFF